MTCFHLCGALYQKKLFYTFFPFQLVLLPSNFSGPGGIKLRFRGPASPRLNKPINVRAGYLDEQTNELKYFKDYSFMPFPEEQLKPIVKYDFNGHFRVQCPYFKSSGE